MIKSTTHKCAFLTLFFVSFFFLKLQGEIVQIETIVDLLKFSDRQTLVVLDITNTLVQSTPSGVKLVEPMTSKIIRQLQEKGTLLLGLTAAHASIANKRMHQLLSVGIDLSTSTVCSKEIAFKSKYPAKFVGGIIFSGRRNEKGETLFRLLDRIRFKPSHLLFIDDQIDNVQSVHSAAKKRGISFVGLHYTPQS